MASQPKADLVRINVRSFKGAQFEIEPPSSIIDVRFQIDAEKEGVGVHIEYEGGTIPTHVPSAVFLKALRAAINLVSQLDDGIQTSYGQEELLALVARILRRRTNPRDDKSS